MKERGLSSHSEDKDHTKRPMNYVYELEGNLEKDPGYIRKKLREMLERMIEKNIGCHL